MDEHRQRQRIAVRKWTIHADKQRAQARSQPKRSSSGWHGISYSADSPLATPVAKTDRSRKATASVISWNWTNLWSRIVAEIDHGFIDVTPPPAFGRIVTFDDWVTGGVNMLGRMTSG